MKSRRLYGIIHMYCYFLQRVKKMNEISSSMANISPISRNIYMVCCTAWDPISLFHDTLYRARRRFFETGRTAHIKETGVYYGLSGESAGKVSRHNLKWKKSVGRRVLESHFSLRKQRGIEFRTPEGILRCRMFLDRDNRWVRSEYYAPDNPMRAVLSFKPDPVRDAVLRFDYNHSTGKTKETVLLPVPYAFQTPEQSLQNARFGENLFLIAGTDGEFAYCPEAEQKQRLEFLEAGKDASVMLSMGWEVQDGEVTAPEAAALPESAEEPAAQPELHFENLEETVWVEVPDEDELPESTDEPETEAETAEAEPAVEEDPADVLDPAVLDALGISAEDAVLVRGILDKLLDKPAAEPISAPPALIRRGEEMHYTGDLENGSREGFGRTETADGITLYEGEYKNDLQDGFGAQHYKSGAVSYIGDFKENKREGFGISFRESDHAMHISRWADNKPEGYATLFSPDGTLRYTGKIIDGQKQGFGVSVNPDDDTVFVAKYKDNEMTGDGALFAGDGTLLYTGGWKDGKRHGYGTEFDRNGDVVYAGEWQDDRYLNGILYKKVQGDPENGSN